VEDKQAGINRPTDEADLSDRLWPSPAYSRQIEALKRAIGQALFLVELKPGDINLGIRISDTPFELLGVVEFPRPDPENGLAPHLLLLDDGRGINLGRIARITVNTPFDPPAEEILYQDGFLMQRLLFCERSLSKASIAAKSRVLLGKILGKTVDESIKRGKKTISDSDAPTSSTEVKRPQQRLLLPK